MSPFLAMHDIGDSVLAQQPPQLLMPRLHFLKPEGLQCRNKGLPMRVDLPDAIEHLVFRGIARARFG